MRKNQAPSVPTSMRKMIRKMFHMRDIVAFVWKILHQDKGLRGASQAVVPTSFTTNVSSLG